MQQAEKDAIQEDVSSFEIEAKKEPVDIDRVPEDTELPEDDPRAAIYKKHAESRQAEQAGTPVGTEADIVDPPEEKPVDEMVKVKVNGEEREVPRSKIEAAGGIAAYQKNAAASELLNQASAKERQLRQQEAQLQARAQEQQRREQEWQTRVTPAPLPQQGATDTKELARKYHEALLEGDIDAASDFLDKMQAARNATPDMEEVTRQAAARVRRDIENEQHQAAQQRFEQERDMVAGTFADKYPDLAADPELFDMTDRKTIEIQARNPSWSPAQIIEAAAENVREWFNGKTAPTPNSDKLEAKRQQTTVRGGSARSVPRPAPKPVSRSQYVEDLRIKRGLE